jgi:formylglycine-generating enzyme required for sulfatase activity
MWTLLIAATFAGPVVLGPASDPSGAAARIAEVTGTPAERLHVESVGEWTSSLPVTFDGGLATGCFGGPVEARQLEASLMVIGGPVLEERPDTFAELMHRLEADLACLSDPVSPARFYLAKARHAMASGDATTAQTALRTAKGMGAEPTSLSPELAAAFEAVSVPEGAVPVRLVPYPDAVWVDGQRLTHGDEGVTLPRGKHLVTLRGTRTTSVLIDVQGPGTLVAPGAYDGGILSELAVPYRERAMAELVELSPARAAWLSDGVSVYKATHRGVRDLTGPPRSDRGVVRRPGDDMVCLPAGSFLMGSDEGPRPERPKHVVYVDGFCILDHPVTQAEYLALTNLAPSAHRGCPTCPVERVSYRHATEYANALSSSQGLTPAYGPDGRLDPDANGWRLPTEAQWEYAARGGQPHDYAGHNEASAVGWVMVDHPQPVCGKPRNGFGLCDMTGNVREFTDTWSHPYPSEPQVNPTGPTEGQLKITRGGSFKRDARAATVSFRSMTTPTSVSDEVGFRLVRPR